MAHAVHVCADHTLEGVLPTASWSSCSVTASTSICCWVEGEPKLAAAAITAETRRLSRLAVEGRFPPRGESSASGGSGSCLPTATCDWSHAVLAADDCGRAPAPVGGSSDSVDCRPLLGVVLGLGECHVRKAYNVSHYWKATKPKV
jgi:hypothetical protein